MNDVKAFATLFGFAVVVGVLAAGVAVVVTVAAGYGLWIGGRALVRARRRRAAAATHRARELAAAAELQHRWYLDGDPRGTYGKYRPAA